MLLPTQTFKLNLYRTIGYLLVLGTLVFQYNTLKASTNVLQLKASAAKKHKRKVKQFDTLFCGNAPIAKTVKAKALGDSFETKFYYHLTDTSLLMGVKPLYIENKDKSKLSNTNTLYFQFNFPNIGMRAEYKSKGIQNEIEELICSYGLLNKNGLDTLKSEMFATVHGQAQAAKKVDAEKLFIVERNKNAEIKIKDVEISQDGIFLGRCEEEELDGPDGKIIQYSIFNSTGALVCVASKITVNKNSNMIQWNLLTQRDMRFSTVQLKSENSVIELLNYLVSKSII